MVLPILQDGFTNETKQLNRLKRAVFLLPENELYRSRYPGIVPHCKTPHKRFFVRVTVFYRITGNRILTAKPIENRRFPSFARNAAHNAFCCFGSIFTLRKIQAFTIDFVWLMLFFCQIVPYSRIYHVYAVGITSNFSKNSLSAPSAIFEKRKKPFCDFLRSSEKAFCGLCYLFVNILPVVLRIGRFTSCRTTNRTY